MPFELKKRRVKAATCEMDGQTVHFTYAPDSYTPALLDKFARVQVEQTKQDPNMTLVASVTVDLVLATVASWDIENDGVPVPITRESVSDLPFSLLNAIVGGMNSEQAPDPTN